MGQELGYTLESVVGSRNALHFRLYSVNPDRAIPRATGKKLNEKEVGRESVLA